jgi:prolipoprotein diacylglyceryltransferase
VRWRPELQDAADIEGMSTMMTMQSFLRRVEVRWIGLWLAGAVCGVLLMIGISTLREPSHTSSASVADVLVPEEPSALIGGRLGGITSSDTATDWYVRQGLTVDAMPIPSSGPAAIGGRLGGIDTADTPTDAAAKKHSQQIVGPGESLNTVP